MLRVWLSVGSFLCVVPSLLAEDVKGVLVDTAGKPIAGATLSAISFSRDRASRGALMKSYSAVTAKDGSFEVKNLPRLPSKDLPITMLVRLSKDRLSFVSLTAQSGRFTAEDSTVRVKLVAKDSKGRPVAGVVGLLEGFYRPGQVESTNITIQPSIPNRGRSSGGITDKNGVAWLCTLPPDTNGLIAVSKNDASRKSLQFITSKGKDVELSYTYYQPGKLSGSVTLEGKPVAHAAVQALSTSDSGAEQSHGTTDSEGHFEIAGVRPGLVKLIFAGSRGYEGYVSKPIRDVRLGEGKELDGLTLVLEKAITIRGSILTIESEKPVPHARIQISPTEGPTSYVETNEKGEYEATVPPGHQYVALSEINGRRVNKSVYAHADVDAENNPKISLRVPDSLTYAPIKGLTGTVLDASGKPVAGAKVLNYRTRVSVTTDGRGTYTFPDEINPGDTILAVKGDAMSKLGGVVSDKAKIDLVLDGKAASISGVIVGEDNKPLSGVNVTLGGTAEEGWYSFPATTTDSQGRYVFSGIYHGIQSYFLWMKQAGYGPATIQSIAVGDGEQKKLELTRMRLADGTISGQVVDENGKPASGIIVSSQVQDTPTALTDEKGKFSLTKVPRGSHYVIVFRGNRSAGGQNAKTGDKDVVIKLEKEVADRPGTINADRVGFVAPAISVAGWLSGTGYTPEQLKGKIVVIDFWATWCRPCVESLSAVEALHKKYKDKGVIVIGIHTPNPDKAKFAALVKEKGLTYSIAEDGKEKNGIGASAVAFGPSGIPHMFLIDANGKIRVDTHEVEDIESVLQKLLGGK